MVGWEGHSQVDGVLRVMIGWEGRGWVGGSSSGGWGTVGWNGRLGGRPPTLMAPNMASCERAISSAT